MAKVLKKGWKKHLNAEDLYKLNDFLELENHLRLFEEYRIEKTKQNWSLTKIFARWIIPIWFFIFFGFLMVNVLSIANPYLLEAYLNWYFDWEGGATRGVVILIILSVISIIKPFFGQHGMRAGARVMISLQCIMFGLYSKKL